MTHQHAIESMASERYLLGEMSDEERDRFESHYFDCAECAEDVRAAERMRAAVRHDARRAAAVPAATAAPRPEADTPVRGKVIRPPRSAWQRIEYWSPWAAAACLALVLGFQSFYVIPALRQTEGYQAVDLTMLRSATRNREPLLRVVEGSRYISVAIDVMVDDETRVLDFDLRNADGNALLSGRVGAPRPGSPLMLLLAAETFEVPARYTLLVRDPDRPEKVSGEYPFVTTR
jgi:hypothetical protein